MRGHEWPHRPGGGIEFIDRTARHINSAVIGRANDTLLKIRLLSAAQDNAFTRLDFGARGGSSPAFVSAVIVENVSYAVGYLRSRNALTAGELKTLDGWVSKLLENAGTRAGSRDHKAILASSRIIWGAASGNSGLFRKGQRQLESILGGLKRGAELGQGLRNNNEVMHHVIGGAAVLRLNGIDVFAKRYGKLTLHDAIAQHATKVVANGGAKVKTAGDTTDQARSFLRAQGWGTHLAWIPVYLSYFPNSGAAKEVRALDKLLRQSDRKPYWGIQMGVHTGCLFGRAA